jgi:sterol desaturase/sphingolipid hydroxylase (fatty acid hydroxylase superfamily)
MFGIFVAVNGMLQHCNVKMRFGFLNWIFATAELHRWHHSKKLEESNTNFGNNIILWDILMGTRFCPSDRLPHSEIGLPDGTNFPETYWGHILTPLNWEEIRYDGTTSNKIKEKIIEDSALLEVDKSV